MQIIWDSLSKLTIGHFLFFLIALLVLKIIISILKLIIKFVIYFSLFCLLCKITFELSKQNWDFGATLNLNVIRSDIENSFKFVLKYLWK